LPSSGTSRTRCGPRSRRRYICIYVSVYLNIHIYGIYRSIDIDIDIYRCISQLFRLFLRSYITHPMWAAIKTDIYMYICLCIYTYTYICIHTYTYRYRYRSIHTKRVRLALLRYITHPMWCVYVWYLYIYIYMDIDIYIYRSNLVRLSLFRYITHPMWAAIKTEAAATLGPPPDFSNAPPLLRWRSEDYVPPQ